MRIDHSGEERVLGSKGELLPAFNGADLKLSLSVNPDSRILRAEVEGKRTGKEEVKPYHLEELTSPSLCIDISTAGLKGQDGRWGRNGHDGARGTDGIEAGEITRGSDGGPGQDGGDGTPGSSGTPGGDAGNVCIRLKEEDTDLLAFTLINTSGGPGGARGGHGAGGKGGPGGLGGKSLTRTTTEWAEVLKVRREQRWEEGRGTFEEEHHSIQIEPRQVVHHVPGGHDGERGLDGRTPTAALYPGENGKNGVLSIEVFSDDGGTKYPGVYQLVLKSFSVVPSVHTRTEKGQPMAVQRFDTVAVENIEIANHGLMPTPNRQRFRISVRPNEFFAPVSNELYILDSIPPGESVVLNGKLFLTAQKSGSTSLELTAYGTRFGAELPFFSKGKEIRILEAFSTRITGDFNICPDQILPMNLELFKRFVGATGPKKSDGQSNRGVRCRLTITPQNGYEAALVFCNKDGSQIYGTSLDVPLSPPTLAQSNVAQVYVKSDSQARPRDRYSIRADFSVEEYGKEGNFETFTADKPVEVVFKHRYSPTDDVLLLVSRGASIEEVNKRREYLEFLGLSYSTWDQEARDGERWSNGLLADWCEKLILTDWAGPEEIRLMRNYNVGFAAYRMAGELHSDDAQARGFFRRAFSTISERDTVNVEGFKELAALFEKDPAACDKEYIVNVTDVVHEGRSVIGVWGDFERYVFQKLEGLSKKYSPHARFLVRAEHKYQILWKLYVFDICKVSHGRVMITPLAMPNERELYKVNRKNDSPERGWLAEKITILASMPIQQQVSHALKVLLLKESSAELVDCVVNGLLFKVWRDASSDLNCYFTDSLRGNRTLAAFSRELVERLQERTDIPTDRIALFVSKVALLEQWLNEHHRCPRPWYRRVFSSLGEAWRSFVRSTDSRQVVRDSVSFITLNMREHLSHIKDGLAANVGRTEYSAFESLCDTRSAALVRDGAVSPYALAGLPEDAVLIVNMFPPEELTDRINSQWPYVHLYVV